MKNETIEELYYGLNTMYPQIKPEKVKPLIYNCLKDYDVIPIKETTTLATADFSTEILLRAFKIYKMSQNITEGTIEQYELAVHQLCNFVNKPLQAITSDDITYFLYAYKEMYSCSNTTMNNKRLYLSSVFSTLYNHGKIPNNPASIVPCIKRGVSVTEPLNDTEIETLRMACSENKRMSLIIPLALDTGCRINELINIKFQDIDFTKHRIKVKGKGNKERIVLYRGATAVRLEEYLNYRLMKENKNTFTSDEYLLVREKAPYTKITKNALTHEIMALKEKVNIPRLHMHLFRHTCATTLARCGVSVDKISKYLGHSNINTTMIYIQNDIDNVLRTIEIAG